MSKPTRTQQNERLARIKRDREMHMSQIKRSERRIADLDHTAAVIRATINDPHYVSQEEAA